MKLFWILVFIIVSTGVAYAPKASFCDKHYNALKSILEPFSFDYVCR